MEGLPENGNQIWLEKSLFKPGAAEEIGELGIPFSAIENLASLLSHDKDELYSRYHNLFSLQKENSLSYINGLIEFDKIKLTQVEGDKDSYLRVQNRIQIAAEFRELLENFTWINCFNLVYFLEEYLQ